jgi:hypothetical protein
MALTLLSSGRAICFYYRFFHASPKTGTVYFDSGIGIAGETSGGRCLLRVGVGGKSIRPSPQSLKGFFGLSPASRPFEHGWYAGPSGNCCTREAKKKGTHAQFGVGQFQLFGQACMKHLTLRSKRVFGQTEVFGQVPENLKAAVGKNGSICSMHSLHDN